MTRYRKKPVVVEATQWFRNGGHPEDDREWFTDPDTGESFLGEGKVVRYYRDPYDSGTRTCQHCGSIMHEHGWIDTLEGGHIVCPGDFVITGVQGERYPVKPEIFAQTYDELVEGDEG